MRKPMLLTLVLFCLLPLARAQEEAPAPAPAPVPAGDAVTAQVPKWSPFVLRVTSLDRVDAIAKEAIPVLKSFGLEQQVAPIEMMGASGFLFQMSGLDAALVDRTKPIYLALAGEEDPHVLLHAAEGASWEGQKELQHGMAAALRSGAIVCTGPRARDAETRGAPTAIALDGDLVVHVYLGDIIEANKGVIEEKAAQAVMQAGAAPMLPDAAKGLMVPVVNAVKEAVFSVESFEYAVTLKQGWIQTEGLLATKPRSALRNFFKRAGAPGNTDDLVGYLPKNCLLYTDTVAATDWPLKEMATLLDNAAGEGAGKALLSLMSMSTVFSDQLTGRSATGVSIGGMMMGTNVYAIAELKEGADINAAIEKLDTKAANESLAKMGVPISFTIEKSIAKHGETPLHKISMQSENPALAGYMAMLQTYVAAEGRHLVYVTSPTAEDDLRGLLDKVRTGKPEEHPHAKAMARLGRAHNVGFSLNVGALKPMGMMIGMFMPVPSVQQAFAHLPDELYFSTAITFADGDLHWRGDWPSDKIIKMAQAIQAEEAKKEKEAEEGEEEEDFD